MSDFLGILGIFIPWSVGTFYIWKYIIKTYKEIIGDIKND